MNIVLFGGEGFVGQNLVDVLKTKHKCCSISRNPSCFGRNTDLFVARNPYIDLRKEQSDVYIHLIDNKDYDEISLAKSIQEGSRLILFSSAVIYANPTSEYAIRKRKTEKFYEDYCENHGINLTILRLFNIYGYYQIPFRQGSLVGNIFYNYLGNLPSGINRLEVSRDFIFASDATKVVEKVIAEGICGTYDLATGKMYTLAELIESVESVVGEKLRIEVMNGEDILCPPARNIIPYEFGTLREGIRKTFRFYSENIELMERIVKS